MSKSKGEFLTVSLIEGKGYDPLAYRLFCLQSHYRKPLIFSYEALDQAAGTYKKLKKRIADLDKNGAVDEAAVQEFKAKFVEAVGNDVNTSMGVTLLYDVLKTELNGATKRAIIGSYDEVLSLDLLKEEIAVDTGVDAELEAYVLAKIEERKAAKKEKNFALADAIRNELLDKGIVLEDTREGVKWKKA
jgi:cysteinyl-tRNA synthetase